MIFGPRPPTEALGGTLAHAVRAEGVRLAKGTVLDAGHVRALRLAGVGTVEVALPEPGDVGEDEAAGRCAAAMLAAGAGLTADSAATGRANLRAAHDGLLVPDRDAIDRLNAIDPRLTVATLAEGRVTAGELVATVKVVPFHVADALVAAWERLAAPAHPPAAALRVAGWSGVRVSHVSTVLPSLKGATMDKTRRVLAARLEGTGASLGDERRVPHGREALAAALRGVTEAEAPDVLLVFGASAVTDAADVVPAAIGMAGGAVERVGMPVDPGNLLVLARLGPAVLIGAPGCARSPARNGFDMVLDRALAGVPVAPAGIARMGVGGLLKEIPSRPRPREGVPQGATGSGGPA